jgi:hypothetical protein
MRRHPFFLIVCALFLLGAQQASFVHCIGHIGADIRAVSVHWGSGDGDDRNTPSGECGTCIAFAALNAAPPAFIPAIAEAQTTAIAFQETSPADLPARCAPSYTARAPPVLL